MSTTAAECGCEQALWLKAEVTRLRAEKDAAYAERNRCVAALAHLANRMGYPVGVAEHPVDDQGWDAEWRSIVFVGLPTGQVSWHFHDSDLDLVSRLPTWVLGWDGHSTEEKYRRCDALREPAP